jgi:hypothetical protein
MAEYLNPADRVLEVGKPALKTELVPAGHVLVGVYDNGVRRVAPVLTPSELEYFESAYSMGAWLSRKFCHVPMDIAREMGARL